jgi:hypothetical protein
MKEKGASISDEEGIEILDFMNQYYSSPPPKEWVSPEIWQTEHSFERTLGSQPLCSPT